MIRSLENPMSNDPLHGKTLKSIVEYLVAFYGWTELRKRIMIKCFTNDPSVNSSLKFLRKTEWARIKVEELYVQTVDPDVTSPPPTRLRL